MTQTSIPNDEKELVVNSESLQTFREAYLASFAYRFPDTLEGEKARNSRINNLWYNRRRHALELATSKVQNSTVMVPKVIRHAYDAPKRSEAISGDDTEILVKIHQLLAESLQIQKETLQIQKDTYALFAQLSRQKQE